MPSPEESGNGIEVLRTDLSAYLMARFGYRRDPVDIGISPRTVFARRKAFDVYVRLVPNAWDPWPDGTLVVARIGFGRPKQGHGRSLVTFLSDWGERHGYRFIGIEQANRGCALFAAKLGFTELNNAATFLATIKIGRRPALPSATPE